jgi:hypothetical protein
MFEIQSLVVYSSWEGTQTLTSLTPFEKTSANSCHQVCLSGHGYSWAKNIHSKDNYVLELFSALGASLVQTPKIVFI